jgi:hypothetical protein
MGMGQEPNQGSAGEMMIVGLIDHADRLGKSAQNTQQALAEKIQELAQLQQWAVNAALDLQKRADAAIQKLEAERARLQGTQINLERNAVQALHDAVEKQSAGIGRQVEQGLASPLRDVQHAAAQVRQNIKDSKWLFVVSVFLLGAIGGLLISYFFVIRTQNAMDDRLDRIEQSLAAQQPTSPASDAKPAGKLGKPRQSH